MGEQADYMINGDDCDVCGMPFVEEGAGFPRTCKDCWRGMSPDERKNHQKADSDTV